MAGSIRGKSAWPALVLGAVVGACERPSAPTPELSLDDLPSIAVVEEIRIGSVEDPDIGFSRINGVDVDGDGRVYVFEGLDLHIRVYDSDGEPLHRIGGPGQGPGEFERAPLFGVRGDTVWTVDGFGGRITLFSRTGELIGTERAEQYRIPVWGGRFVTVLPFELLADGSYLGRMTGTWSSDRDPAPEIAADEEVLVPRIRYDARGQVRDTIGWDPRPNPGLARPPDEVERRSTGFARSGGRLFLIPGPPADHPRWIERPDGLVIVDAPTPPSEDGVVSVTRLGLYLDTLFHRTFHHTALGYTSEELDARARSYARNGRPMGAVMPLDVSDLGEIEGDERAIARALRNAMEFPDFRPATTYAQVDEDERIWIRRDEPPGATTSWALLGPDGLPGGEIALDGRPQWSSGSVLWVSEIDDLGVPWLVRYRLDL